MPLVEVVYGMMIRVTPETLGGGDLQPELPMQKSQITLVSGVSAYQCFLEVPGSAYMDQSLDVHS